MTIYNKFLLNESSFFYATQKEQLSTKAVLRGFFETLRQIWIYPNRIFATVSADSNIIFALTIGVICHWLSQLFLLPLHFLEYPFRALFSQLALFDFLGLEKIADPARFVFGSSFSWFFRSALAVLDPFFSVFFIYTQALILWGSFQIFYPKKSITFSTLIKIVSLTLTLSLLEPLVGFKIAKGIQFLYLLMALHYRFQTSWIQSGLLSLLPKFAFVLFTITGTLVSLFTILKTVFLGSVGI